MQNLVYKYIIFKKLRNTYLHKIYNVKFTDCGVVLLKLFESIQLEFEKIL